MKCQRSVRQKLGIRGLERMSSMKSKLLVLATTALAGFGIAVSMAQESDVPQSGPAANGEPALFILQQGGRAAAPAAAPAPAGGQSTPGARAGAGRAGGGGRGA